MQSTCDGHFSSMHAEKFEAKQVLLSHWGKPMLLHSDTLFNLYISILPNGPNGTLSLGQRIYPSTTDELLKHPSRWVQFLFTTQSHVNSPLVSSHGQPSSSVESAQSIVPSHLSANSTNFVNPLTTFGLEYCRNAYLPPNFEKKPI